MMRNVIYKRKKNYIVDRDIESLKIKNDIENSKKSKINIVYSKTALGKSTLSEKVLNAISDSYTKIVIKTINQNNRNSAIEGEYFSLLFNALVKKFENNSALSLRAFIKKNNNRQLQKDIIHSYLSQWINASSIINVLLSGFYYFIQKWFCIGYFDIDTIVEKESALQKKIQFYYVTYILLHTPCIIVFENFQNIDYQSFNKLIECIAQSREKLNYYIFEYTIGDNSTYTNLETLKDYLSDYDILIEITPLEKLDSDYLPDLINKHFEIMESDINFNKKMITFYNKNATGNLRQIIDFSFQYNEKINIKENPTLKRIWELSELELTVLITIIYVNESYDECDLINFWNKYKIGEESIKRAVIKLSEKQIITIDGHGKLVLAHASIYDIWEKYRNNNEMSKINSLVYQKLTEFYLGIWNDETIIKKGQTWEFLLQLYAIGDPTKLWSLFSDLREKLFLSISPENAWKYINMFIHYSRKDYSEYIKNYITILNICFEFELYESAYALLQFLIEKVSLSEYPEIAIYKCMYLSALDRHNDNIKYYNEIKNMPYFTKRHIFNMNLCILSSYRSLGIENEWYKLYTEMIKDKKYHSLPEYGYLLRLADMYFERQKALPLVKKSISFFKRHNLPHQAGKSMITAAHLSAGLGRLHYAYYLINNSEKILNTKIMGQHMILVNKAVIFLLLGKKDKSIIDLLDDASLSATVPFDKLAIIVNKLAWMIANDSFNNFQLLVSQGHRYIQREPDKHIHALFFYNVYYIYKRKHIDDKADQYLKLTQNVMNYCVPVKERLNHTASKNNKTVLKKPFHICFLTYWTFDILLESGENTNSS